MTFIIGADLNSEDNSAIDNPSLIDENCNEYSRGSKKNHSTIVRNQNNVEKINNRKNGVSIDVTKALVLLGFDSWSSLEPGNFQFNRQMLIS